MKYRLEICRPGYQAKSDGVAALFESDVPFSTVSVGHLINPRTWGDDGTTARIMARIGDENWTLLRVIGVEHLLRTNKGEIVHTTMIHTEVAPDTYETRYPR